MCDASTVAAISTSAQAVGAVASAAGAYNKSKSDKKVYEYQAKVADNNAQLADQQARDAIRRGQTAEGEHSLKVAQLLGTQRASMAARGLDLGEGSALNILDDTQTMSGIDAGIIRDNASREATGYSQQSANYKGNADILRSRAGMENPFASGATTLLTGAGKVADSWYKYSEKAKGATK